jgi:hypothetical protein
VPELDEPHQLTGLVGAGEVRVGIAQDPAPWLVGEEAQDTGSGLALHGEVMIVEDFGVAPMGDGMEVEAELLGVGEQDGGQSGDPPREQGLLAGARGAVGVVGGEALLGQDVQPGEEAERLVEVEIADMAASLLIG